MTQHLGYFDPNLTKMCNLSYLDCIIFRLLQHFSFKMANQCNKNCFLTDMTQKTLADILTLIQYCINVEWTDLAPSYIH